jgi:hypothetical protein
MMLLSALPPSSAISTLRLLTERVGQLSRRESGR